MTGLFLQLLNGRASPHPGSSTSVYPHKAGVPFVYILRLQRNRSSQDGPEGVTYLGHKESKIVLRPIKVQDPQACLLPQKSGVNAQLHT